jgi:hypothetical protein
MSSDMPDSSTEDLEEINFVCMECGYECEKHETIHTGDENSLRGWEVWCYCNACDAETFHPIKLKTK